MQGAYRDQILGDTRQQPERLMHDAHCPEIIDKRRIGAKTAIAVADDFPGLLAVQEVVQRQFAAGQHGPGDIAEAFQRLVG